MAKISVGAPPAPPQPNKLWSSLLNHPVIDIRVKII